MKKFYNLGARSFMLTLIFEAPKLQVIEIADNIDLQQDCRLLFGALMEVSVHVIY